MALYEVAVLFGTLVAETILASVNVRAHKEAGHMDASDLIKALQNTLQGGGRPHMENSRPAVERAHNRCAMLGDAHPFGRSKGTSGLVRIEDTRRTSGLFSRKER